MLGLLEDFVDHINWIVCRVFDEPEVVLSEDLYHLNFLLLQIVLEKLGLVDFLAVLVDRFEADTLLNLSVFLLGLIDPVSDNATDFDFVGNHHENDVQSVANALQLVHELFPQEYGLFKGFFNDNRI